MKNKILENIKAQKENAKKLIETLDQLETVIKKAVETKALIENENMKMEYRTFKCDKCHAIKKIQTNHEGQVIGQKCPNWPCTAGQSSFSTFTFWLGPTEFREASFYARAGDTQKARLEFGLTNKCLTNKALTSLGDEGEIA